MSIHTDYLEEVFNCEDFVKRVNQAAKTLKTVKFDAIAVSGNSGTIFGGALSFKMKKPLILVRKDGENSHVCWEYKVESGNTNAKTFLIVDDFYCSGKTWARIIDGVYRLMPKCIYAGCYSYRNDGYISPGLTSEFWTRPESDFKNFPKEPVPEPKPEPKVKSKPKIKIKKVDISDVLRTEA